MLQVAACGIYHKGICGVGTNTDTVIGACAVQPGVRSAIDVKDISGRRSADIPFQLIGRRVIQYTVGCRNDVGGRCLGGAVGTIKRIDRAVRIGHRNDYHVGGSNFGDICQYVLRCAAGAGNLIGIHRVERNIFLGSIRSFGRVQGRLCFRIADSAGGPADEGIAVLAVVIGSRGKLIAGVNTLNSTYLTGYREADGSQRIVTILANAVHVVVLQGSDDFRADGLAAIVTGDGDRALFPTGCIHSGSRGVGVLTGGRGSLIVDSHSIAAAYLRSHAGDGKGIGDCSRSNGDLVTACRSGSTCTLGGVHQSTCIGTAAAKKLDLRNITQRAFNDQLRLCIQTRGCIVCNIAGRTGLIVCQFNAIFFPNLIAGTECGTVACNIQIQNRRFLCCVGVESRCGKQPYYQHQCKQNG